MKCFRFGNVIHNATMINIFKSDNTNIAYIKA